MLEWNGIRKDQKGSAAIEAAIGIPIFLFLLLFFFHLIQVRAVRQVVYEAGIEAAEYAAEYAYLTSEFELAEGDTEGLIDSATLLALAAHKLQEGLDDPSMVARYVSGGASGISLLGSEFSGPDEDLVLHISYTICIDTPFLPTVSQRVEETIRQKPYTGHVEREPGDTESDPYVYITDNREVYHISRGCTHLTLSIHTMVKKQAESKGYKPCYYCGRMAGDFVLIGPEGDCYHGSENCRGLKRTVHRVRLSEVSDIPRCSRCGK